MSVSEGVRGGFPRSVLLLALLMVVLVVGLLALLVTPVYSGVAGRISSEVKGIEGSEGGGSAETIKGLEKITTVLSSALAFSAAILGSAIGIALVGSASISAMVEKPELRVWGLILTALAEALAIYGIAMAFLILTSG